MRGMHRREFIERTVAAGFALAALDRGRLLAEEPKAKSLVVKAVRDDATHDKKINAAVVREMVHAAVRNWVTNTVLMETERINA